MAPPTPVFLPGQSHGQRSKQATVHGVARVRHNLATKERERIIRGKKKMRLSIRNTMIEDFPGHPLADFLFPMQRAQVGSLVRDLQGT